MLNYHIRKEVVCNFFLKFVVGEIPKLNCSQESICKIPKVVSTEEQQYVSTRTKEEIKKFQSIVLCITCHEILKSLSPPGLTRESNFLFRYIARYFLH